MQSSSEPSSTGNIANNLYKKLVIAQREPAFFTLAAKTKSKFGILPQEVFLLKARQKVSTDFIKANLANSNSFTINPINDTEFELKPQKLLGTNQVITVALAVKNKKEANHSFDRNYSWSYQTQGKFRVISYLPGNKVKDVPINTGIEFTFSQDDYEEPSNFISITPSIKYRIERHAETVAIVPLQPLNYATIYTVFLKKGLNITSRDDPIDTDLDITFQTQTKTEQKKIPFLSLDKDFVQVTPQDPLIAKVFVSDDWGNEKVKTKIFQFPSVLAFLESRQQVDRSHTSWYGYVPENNIIDTKNLSLVTTVDLTVQSQGDDNYNRLHYLQLPSVLPSGMYLAQFTYGKDQIEQLWFQVTSVGGYIAMGDKQTTVWVNNLQTGQAVTNAKVHYVPTGSESATNDQGVAIFSTPELSHENNYLLITDTNNQQLILPMGTEQSTIPTKDNYWYYLYHEREIYLPSDTIYFWGVLKNRDTNTPPANATVVLQTSQYYTDKASPNVFAKQNITIAPDGSFIGSISYNDLPPQWYYLSLQINGEEITSSGFSVTEYVKPEMKIEVSVGKKAIASKEKIDMTARSTFYDGTPVAHTPINAYNGYDYSPSSDATKQETDDQGKLIYTLNPSDDTSYPGEFQCVTFAPAVSQQSKVEGQGCVYVVQYQALMETSSKQDNNQAQITARVNKVDVEGYNSSRIKDFKGDPIDGQKITFEATKYWWETKENGTYYDFIEKVTRPSYTYIQKQETIPTQTLSTNANGEAIYNITLEENKSYTVTVNTTDKNNKVISKKEYLYYYKGSNNYYQNNNSSDPELTLKKSENSFSLGEDVELAIEQNQKAYVDTDKNRFLFIVAQRGAQEAIVMDKPEFHFTFQDKYIPNTYVGAIIFTGNIYKIVHAPCKWNYHCSYYDYYYNSSFPGLSIEYKKEDRQLSLNFSYDKLVYKPGETAVVTISVENQKKEKVKDAQVNLVLVDQALEAIGGVVPPSIFPNIYQGVGLGISFSYHSHEPVLPEKQQAEMGGGGGGARELFKDTAYFGEQKTNDQGEALFTLKLPDNITSWRVYAQAVTPNVEIGQENSALITTQDFFVIAGFPQNFLTKDKPLLVGSSYGKSISQDTPVSYTATFYNGDEEVKKEERESSAYKPIDFSFPQQNSGKYSFKLAGKTNALEDALKLPYEVIDSRFSMQQQINKVLHKNEFFQASIVSGLLSQKPYTIVVSDQGKGRYYWDLINFCYTESNRLEKNLAKVVAGQILKDQFDIATCEVKNDVLTAFQTNNGGLAQVKWGSDNLDTTTWAIFVDPNAFDSKKLLNYLDNQFNQKSAGTVQEIQAAWGLTRLGKPQVTTLRNLAQTANTFKEKVYLGLALASIGETELARDLYFDILADYAYEYKPYIRIQDPASTKSDDDTIKNTSLTLLLGGMVQRDYNAGLYAYLRDFSRNAQDIVLDLSQISFIKDQLESANNEFTTLTFTSSSRNINKEMKTDAVWALQLLPNEQTNYSLQVKSGKAEVTSKYFIGEVGIESLKDDSRLLVKRSYKKVKGTTDVNLHPGDIVQVTIDFDFDIKNTPCCEYKLTDILPSGLIYINNPSDYGVTTNDYVTQPEKNVIMYSAFNESWWRNYNDKKLVYYARVGSTGTYIAEPAIFQAGIDASVYAHTAIDTVKILK